MSDAKLSVEEDTLKAAANMLMNAYRKYSEEVEEDLRHHPMECHHCMKEYIDKLHTEIDVPLPSIIGIKHGSVDKEDEERPDN